MASKRPKPPEVERHTPLGWYRWHINEYRASRNAGALPWEARAIMRELLDEIWLEGSIPDDLYQLAAIARVPIEVVAKHWERLRVMFVPIPGLDGMLLTNRRIEVERTEGDRRRVRSAHSGRMGGLAKASKKDANPQTSLELTPLGRTEPLSDLGREEVEREKRRGGPPPAILEGSGGIPCPWCGGFFGAHRPGCSPSRVPSPASSPAAS